MVFWGSVFWVLFGLWFFDSVLAEAFENPHLRSAFHRGFMTVDGVVRAIYPETETLCRRCIFVRCRRWGIDGCSIWASQFWVESGTLCLLNS